MKKIFCVLCVLLSALPMCSCFGDRVSDADKITVISREEGSGTREAFSSLLGMTEGGADTITDSAEITNSTSVVLMSVESDENAIGYCSLISLPKGVKTVSVDGIYPTAHNVRLGRYALERAFYLCFKEGEISGAAEDFLSFALSAQGQRIAADAGFAEASDGEAYAASGAAGSVTLAGSTSVAPLAEALAEEYMRLNPQVDVEIQQIGSSSGISSAIEGICDFAMSSRELKKDEALTPVKIASDAIAVIVNAENEVYNLSSEQIKQIFSGKIKTWREAAQ